MILNAIPDILSTINTKTDQMQDIYIYIYLFIYKHKESLVDVSNILLNFVMPYIKQEGE